MLRFALLFRLSNKWDMYLYFKKYLQLSMDKLFKYIFLVIFFTVFACSKEDFMSQPSMPSDFLELKSVLDIRIFGDEIWFRSERLCDTCRISTNNLSTPMISQLSRMKGSQFRFDESKPMLIPVADNHGVLHTATQNEILKINDIRDYTSVLKTGDFTFTQFVFDKNNGIWMGGKKGIAYWDGSKTITYTSDNSLTDTDVTHGMAVDHTGNVWIPLDFKKGLLKITDGNWEVIPYHKIPGLNTDSYLFNPLVDKDNRIWFTAFNSSNPTNVICFDGKNWLTEFPGILKNGELFVDSQGTIWRLNHIIDTSSTMKFTLQFLRNDTWKNYDVSDVTHLILSLDANSEKVYIGTSAGLIIKNR